MSKGSARRPELVDGSYRDGWDRTFGPREIPELKNALTFTTSPPPDPENLESGEEG